MENLVFKNRGKFWSEMFFFFKLSFNIKTRQFFGGNTHIILGVVFSPIYFTHKYMGLSECTIYAQVVYNTKITLFWLHSFESFQYISLFFKSKLLTMPALSLFSSCHVLSLPHPFLSLNCWSCRRHLQNSGNFCLVVPWEEKKGGKEGRRANIDKPRREKEWEGEFWSKEWWVGEREKRSGRERSLE